MNIFDSWARLDEFGFEAVRTLLAVLWQSSILLVAVALLAWLLRKRRASVRYGLWVGALLVVPLLPLLAGVVSRAGAPQASVPVLPVYTAPRIEVMPPVEPIVPLPEIEASAPPEPVPVLSGSAS